MATTPSLTTSPPRPAIAERPVLAPPDDVESEPLDAGQPEVADFADSLEQAQHPAAASDVALESPIANESADSGAESDTNADPMMDSGDEAAAAPSTIGHDGGDSESAKQSGAPEQSLKPSPDSSASAGSGHATAASTGGTTAATASKDWHAASTQRIGRPAASWMPAALSMLAQSATIRPPAIGNSKESETSTNAQHAETAHAKVSTVATSPVEAAKTQSTATPPRDAQVNATATVNVLRAGLMRSRNPTISATSAGSSTPNSQAAAALDAASLADDTLTPPASPAANRTAAARAIEARLNVQSDSTNGDVPVAGRQIPAAARAAALEQAIRLENATGQPVQVIGEGADNPRAFASSNASGGVMFRGAHADAASMMSLVPSDADAPADSFASQAIRGLSAMLNQRGGAMTLRLDPPELGLLRVHMTIVGGNVSAEFTAGSQQTQTLLDRHIATLRQSLESQGLNVERLTVHAAPTSSASNSTARQDADAGNQQHQSWNQQHDAGGSESRGRRDHEQSKWFPPSSFDAGAFSFESLLESDELLATAAGD